MWIRRYTRVHLYVCGSTNWRFRSYPQVGHQRTFAHSVSRVPQWNVSRSNFLHSMVGCSLSWQSFFLSVDWVLSGSLQHRHPTQVWVYAGGWLYVFSLRYLLTFWTVLKSMRSTLMSIEQGITTNSKLAPLLEIWYSYLSRTNAGILRVIWADLNHKM